MKTRKYYAAENHYGSSTSHGFANTWYVLVFRSKSERDTWVYNQPTLTAKAIKRTEVIGYATNYNLSQNCTNAPRPFTPEYWGIIPAFEENQPDHIEKVDPEEYFSKQPERFYH